ncbi:MAG: hypothetical protein IH591_00490, partial [Bacteroidales bacterium]|nr:hypothetical protein [Bacteroidales bacterium]
VYNYSNDTLRIRGNINFANNSILGITSTSGPFLLSGSINTSGGQLLLDYGDFIITGGDNNSFLHGGSVSSTSDRFHNLIVGIETGSYTGLKEFYGTLVVFGDLTINSGSFHPKGAVSTSGSLTMNGGSMVLTTQVSVTNHVIINPGGILTVSDTIYLGGNWANYAGTAGFNESTSLVYFRVAASSAILTDETFYNMRYADFQSPQINEVLLVGGNLTVTNNLEIESGRLMMNSPCTLNVNNNLIIEPLGQIDAEGTGSLIINIGNDLLDNSILSAGGLLCGYNSVLRFNGNGGSKGWQTIHTSSILNDLVIASQATYVYPDVPTLFCRNLIVDSGIFYPNHCYVDITFDLNVSGTIWFNNADDIIDAGQYVRWRSGSNVLGDHGQIYCTYDWYFEDGTSAKLGHNNYVYIKHPGTYANVIHTEDDDASFGNLILDPVSLQFGEFEVGIFSTNQDTLRVTDTLIIGPKTNLAIHDNILKAGSILMQDSTSGITHFSQSTSYVSIASDFMQNGLIDMAHGHLYVHGTYSLDTSGELRISGGSFIYDRPWISYYDPNANWLRGKLVMSDGILEYRDNDLVIAGTFKDSISGGTIRVGKAFDASFPSTFNPTGGTVEFIGSSPPLPLVLYGININQLNSFYNLTINSAYERNLFSDVRVSNDLTIQSGVLNVMTPITGTSHNLTVGHDWINLVGDNGFNEGFGQVSIGYHSLSLIHNSETFYDLRVSSANSLNYWLEWQEGDTITVLNDLSIQGGMRMKDSTHLIVGGDITLFPTAALHATGQDADITLSGDWTDFQPFPTATGGFDPGNSSKVTFKVADTTTIFTIAEQEAFHHLSLKGNDKSTDRITFNKGVLLSGDVESDSVIIELPGNICCRGDVRCNFSNINSQDTVFFQGPRQQKISGISPIISGGVITGYDLSSIRGVKGIVVDKPGSSKSGSLNDTLLIDYGIGFATNGLFDLRHGIVKQDFGALAFFGDVAIGNTAGLILENSGMTLEYCTFNVNNGGLFSMYGSAAEKERLVFNQSKLFVNQGGEISASNIDAMVCCDSGIYIRPGGMVDVARPFDSCIFRPYFADSLHQSMLTIDNSQDLVIRDATFLADSIFSWSYDNVRKSVNQGEVIFLNATGGMAGEDFDDDIYNRVLWADPMSISAMVNPGTLCL